jgi:hypothetical protein
MMQAAALTPTISNSKDDSNNMTAYNNRNANNSRNESNSRTANTVGTPTTAGMIAKVMKPETACRDENNNIPLTSDGSSSRREISNIQQGHQQQPQKLHYFDIVHVSTLQRPVLLLELSTLRRPKRMDRIEGT